MALWSKASPLGPGPRHFYIVQIFRGIRIIFFALLDHQGIVAGAQIRATPIDHLAKVLRVRAVVFEELPG